jgi:hypothetical protein
MTKIEAKPFKGVDWSHSLQRPGCQDHLKYPSRRGDELVPYKAPVLNASNVKVSAAIGQSEK